mmetsp:Transcript_13497/g.38233  ORF Transcript_13497/g.38233 Transcript_13497/m.38233 type:complete len:114 (-) Transcript_13497:38-379(-)|eukprot:scaffold66500_cov35-Tisochrysis_lutea.AAC.2
MLPYDGGCEQARVASHDWHTAKLRRRGDAGALSRLLFLVAKTSAVRAKDSCNAEFHYELLPLAHSAPCIILDENQRTRDGMAGSDVWNGHGMRPRSRDICIGISLTQPMSAGQ